MAVLTNKEQARLRAILLARVTAPRTTLAGVIRINTDTATPRQGGFIGEQSAQLGKGPAGRMAIGFAGFDRDRHPFAAQAAVLSASGSLLYAGQLFHADEGVRMGV